MSVTFNLGTLMTTFYGVGAATVPVFLIIFAAGNFLGPLILGRLFDTVGRKPMVSGTYLGSAGVAVVLGFLFLGNSLDRWSFIGVIVVVFFLASAGASAAYLTASEIFPMETRALAIAFFYAIGTAVGGITGPLLFGNLIGSGKKSEVVIAFFIGAAVMALGGVAELLFGVKAEGVQLEDIAEPLTVRDAKDGAAKPDQPATDQSEPTPLQRRRERERLRRYRPGPGRLSSSPGMAVTRPVDRSLARETESIERALDEHGPLERRELARLVGARYWGPGVFPAALRTALNKGSIRHRSRTTYEHVNSTRSQTQGDNAQERHST